MSLVQVKSLNQFWERVKFSLSTTQCALCQALINCADESSPRICTPCSQSLRFNTAFPLRRFNQSSIYAACGFPLSLKRMIYGLKFLNKKQYAPILAEILYAYWRPIEANQTGHTAHTLVIPIPAHSQVDDEAACSLPSHVSAFGRPFAHRLGVDFWPGGIFWKRPVTPQHQLLSKHRRFENMRAAFEVSPQLLSKLKNGMRVIVVDDLVTTGATMREAVETVAHAVPPGVEVIGLGLSHVPFALRQTLAT